MTDDFPITEAGRPDRAETIRRNLIAAREEQRRRQSREPRPTMLDDPPRGRWDLEHGDGGAS